MADKPQPKKVETKQESDPIKIAIPLIIQNEGFKPNAYYDKLGKVWTIGTGITRYADGTPVQKGDTITREQNDKELYSHLQADHEFLKSRPAYSAMNPNQIASALDLTFNIGHNWTKAKNASLLDATSSPEKLVNFPDAMMKYRTAGGQVVQGLVNRRQRAIELFNRPYEAPVDENKPQPVSISPMDSLPTLSVASDGTPAFDTRPTFI